MPVFKLSLRIIRSNLPFMLLFIGVFGFISILISRSNVDTQRQDFSQSKVAMAFISDDVGPFVDGLRVELAKTAVFVEAEDEAEGLHDAIFSGRLRYVLWIPAGFSQAILDGRRPELRRSAAPNELAASYLDRGVDQYLHSLSLYARLLPELRPEELVARLAASLEASAPVELVGQTGRGGDRFFARTYFNYLAYSLFAILILGISANIMTFNRPLIRQRNSCSPLSGRILSLQILSANLLYALAAWALMVGLCLLLAWDSLGGSRIGLFLLNSLIMCFWAACASFWIGHLAKSRSTVSAATNLIAMASSFISGVFVPQELLGSSLLKVASFTPSYWYVLANDQIAAGARIDGGSLPLAIGLQLGFGLAFLALGLVTAKKRQQAA